MPTIDIAKEFKEVVAEVVELREDIRIIRECIRKETSENIRLRVKIEAMQRTQDTLVEALNEANAHREDNND